MFEYSDFYNSFNEFEKKNAPKELFLEGDSSLLLEGKRVSVVGTREPSKEGILRTEIITKALVEQNIIVVSGLAKGVDTIAHDTSIKSKGRTISVLGTPLDKPYPASNKDLLELIKKDHLAISQFPSGYPFNRKNFPMRNRTMALISDATIIVEATEKSGTQHQAWEALRLGRILFVMKNVAENPNLTWPSKVIDYGAQILNREDLPEILSSIPNLTASAEPAF